MDGIARRVSYIYIFTIIIQARVIPRRRAGHARAEDGGRRQRWRC